MRLLLRLLLFLLFAGVFVAIVAYARGYRLDFTQQSLTSTGIIAASSSPKAAKIFVNGELKGATDTNITMPPGKYTVEIKKDGYIPWKKDLSLKGELVMAADALLFPLNPSLTPLTNLGVGKIVPIDDTGKLLLFSETGDMEKDGIYVFDQSKKPFSLFPPLKLLILKKNLPATVSLLDSRVAFSPDFKEGVFEFLEGEETIVAYDIGFEEVVEEPFDVTASMISLFQAWDEERQQEVLKILETLPKDIRPVASDSFNIISFAPDKTKFLYEIVTDSETLPPVIEPPLISANQETEDRVLTKGKLYVYDIKEDKNFRLIIEDKSFETEETEGEWRKDINRHIMWYPSSRHLVLNEKTQVSVMEYDNTNRQVIYSGPHEQDFLYITADGQLLVLANLNPQTNKSPDVYAVGVK